MEHLPASSRLLLLVRKGIGSLPMQIAVRGGLSFAHRDGLIDVTHLCSRDQRSNSVKSVVIGLGSLENSQRKYRYNSQSVPKLQLLSYNYSSDLLLSCENIIFERI
jgi:hypothetical protein